MPERPPETRVSTDQAGPNLHATPETLPASERVSVPELPATPKEDPIGALKALAEISGLLVALAFVTGWSYMASYYTAFGLNPLELDFSVPVTAAFALHLFQNSGWPFTVLAVPFLLYPFSRRLVPMLRLLAASCIGILLLLAAAAGSRRGRDLAKEDMFETSPRLPTVGFVSRSKVIEPSCLVDGTMDCKLLLHSKGMYYFFTPIRESSGPVSVAVSNINVYAVPESEVSSVHVSPGCGTNDLNSFAKGGCK